MEIGEHRIWMFIFPDTENTGNLPENINNLFLHREVTSNTSFEIEEWTTLRGVLGCVHDLLI